MRSTYKQLYYINRGKVKSDGTTSIMCRITIDGKAVALSTGLYCQPEEWNSKKGEVKNNRLNGMLCEYKKRVDETYAELLKVNGVISAELLKTAMTGTADIPKYILQAGEVLSLIHIFEEQGITRAVRLAVKFTVVDMPK